MIIRGLEDFDECFFKTVELHNLISHMTGYELGIMIEYGNNLIASRPKESRAHKAVEELESLPQTNLNVNQPRPNDRTE